MTAWKAFIKNTALGKLTLMIYLLIALGSACFIIGGAMIAASIDVKIEMKAEKLAVRKKILRSKKLQKRFEMWSQADRIISQVKIESE